MRLLQFALSVIVLATAAALFAARGASEPEIAPATPPAPEVTVAEVLVAPLRNWEEFTGRLEAVDSVELRPRVGGYIESVQFKEGAQIERGNLMFQIDPRPFRAEVNRLTAERERTEAELELARANHARAERLVGKGAISREEFDGLATAENVAAARLRSTQAALEAARLDLEFTRVTAPISGRTSRALITAGNLVDSTTLLTTLVSDDPIYAYFDADEHAYLEYVASGAASHGTPSVYMGLINEQGYPHEGRLDFVDNQVDPANGTIRGRAVFDNRDGRFTPGLFARLRIVSSQSFQAALIDERAIGTDLDKRFVLVVDENNVAQYRAVQTGPVIDGLRVVRAGLEPGDLVIVNGLQRVRPGMAVSPNRIATDRGGRALARVSGPAAPTITL